MNKETKIGFQRINSSDTRVIIALELLILTGERRLPTDYVGDQSTDRVT